MNPHGVEARVDIGDIVELVGGPLTHQERKGKIYALVTRVYVGHDYHVGEVEFKSAKYMNIQPLGDCAPVHRWPAKRCRIVARA
tara:strand:+ start:300 stop:551 length:252 start_codon:yes stop_codon:yes gene_type:complete